MKLLQKDYEPADWPGFTHRLYGMTEEIGVLAVTGHERAPGEWELHPVRLVGDTYRIDYTLHPQVDGLESKDLDEALASIEARLAPKE